MGDYHTGDQQVRFAAVFSLEDIAWRATEGAGDGYNPGPWGNDI